MEKESVLHVGIVGCGYQGGVLAQAVRKSQSCKVVACRLRPQRQQRVGTATSLARQPVVGAPRPTSGNPRSAIPRKAAARASAGARTGRRLDGGYREYARGQRPAPYAALQPHRPLGRMAAISRKAGALVSRPTDQLKLNTRVPSIERTVSDVEGWILVVR